MNRRTMLSAAIVLLVTGLSSCTRDQLESSILGGAKNWCRSQTTTCHVVGAKP